MNPFIMDDASVKKLQKLSHKVANDDPKYRIEFAITAIKSPNYFDLVHNELLDFNLTERDFDRCFEMHDGGVVVHGIMSAAKEDPELKDALHKLSESCIKDWTETYEEVQASIPQQTSLFM